MDQIDKLLLDTDVLNYISIQDHKFSSKYRPLVQEKTILVSFITIAEILYGVYKKRETQQQWMLFSTKKVFPNLPIIYPDLMTCEIFGKLRAEDKLVKPPRNTNIADSWIASCAIQYDLPLLTNNIKHFQHISRLKLIKFDEK